MQSEYYPLAAGNQQPSHEYSTRILDGVAMASENLMAEMPEIVGVTGFGSSVRGEAGPNSDADIMVLIDIDEMTKAPQESHATAGERAFKSNHGFSTDGTYLLMPGLANTYRSKVSESLTKQGIENADILELPISKEIAEDTTKDLLEIAKQLHETPTMKVPVSRNLRALFHAPIAAEKLQPYQAQVLTQLAESPHGESAWALIRQHLIGFERPKSQEDYSGLSHRYIPANLEEAMGFYLKQDYETE